MCYFLIDKNYNLLTFAHVLGIIDRKFMGAWFFLQCKQKIDYFVVLIYTKITFRQSFVDIFNSDEKCTLSG